MLHRDSPPYSTADRDPTPSYEPWRSSWYSWTRLGCVQLLMPLRSRSRLRAKRHHGPRDSDVKLREIKIKHGFRGNTIQQQQQQQQQLQLQPQPQQQRQHQPHTTTNLATTTTTTTTTLLYYSGSGSNSRRRCRRCRRGRGGRCGGGGGGRWNRSTCRSRISRSSVGCNVLVVTAAAAAFMKPKRPKPSIGPGSPTCAHLFRPP